METRESLVALLDEYRVQVVQETEAWYTALLQDRVDDWLRIIGDRMPGVDDTVDKLYNQIGTVRMVIRMMNGGDLPGELP